MGRLLLFTLLLCTLGANAQTVQDGDSIIEGMAFEYVSTESTLLRKINRMVEKLDGYSSSTCLLLPR